MNAYNDVTSLKNRMELASGSDLGTAFDAALLGILQAVSREVDRLTKQAFYVTSATRYYAGDGRLLFVGDPILSITTLKTDRDGDGTYEDTLTEDTDFVLQPVNSFPKLWAEMLPASNYSGFPSRVKGVQIAGVFGWGDGYSATPYDATAITVTVATAAGTTLTLSAEGTIAAGHTILVGTEQMFITAVTADASKTATAIREVNGTTAAAHSAAVASIYDYPEDVMEAVLIQTLRMWERKNSGYQDQQKSAAGDGVISVYKGLDQDVKDMLRPFKRKQV